MTDEMKYSIGYTFALCIPFHLLQCWCNTYTNHITNDMINFISSHDLIGSSILTSLAFHCCLRPSVPSLAQASPPRGPSLQSLQLALHICNRSIKPSLILIFSTLVTWLHVMSHMQWAPSSHMWALQQFQAIFTVMAWVAHTGVPMNWSPVYLTIKHISPPRLSLNYQNQTRDLSISPFLVIDDNSTKIWNLSSNRFMLLARAILSCVKDMDKFHKPKLVALAPLHMC